MTAVGGRLEAVGQVAGADHRLADRGQGPLGGEQGLDRDAGALVGRALAEHCSGAPCSRATSAQARPLTAWLWILVSSPMSASGERAEELRGDGEAEHAVAEEGEAPVGLGARSTQEECERACRRSSSGASANSSASGRMLGPSARRALIPYAGTRAQTKSTASPTVSISAASSSLTRIP